MYEFINGSPENQDDNEFVNIKLKLRGMANLKYFTDPISCDILGQKLSSPVCLGPMPFQGMFHKDGELASAKVAAELN